MLALSTEQLGVVLLSVFAGRTLHCSCAVWEKRNILLLSSVLYWEKDAVGVFEIVE